MRLTRKRVLVTGGAGFLGSHLCESLTEAGNDVGHRRRSSIGLCHKTIRPSAASIYRSRAKS